MIINKPGSDEFLVFTVDEPNQMVAARKIRNGEVVGESVQYTFAEFASLIGL